MQQMHALQAAGYLCSLACRPDGPVARMAMRQGLDCLPVAFRNSLHVPSILALRTALRRRDTHMLICHSGHDTNNAALACRLLRQRPFILRSRTWLTGKHKAFSYNHLVDATMVPSAFIQSSLLADPAIRANKIHVVYPGIDFAHIDEAAKAALPEAVAHWLNAASGPVLLQVAMLRGEKGHAVILRALPGLLQRWPGLRYLIAGEGGERAAIVEQIRSLGLERQVFLAGNVMPVHALYRQASLLLMPSLSEPLGMSQIEALALSVPVLASRTGGIPETVADGVTGCLVTPGDVSAWQQAIDQALSQPDLMRRMAEQGCRDVRSRFSVARNLQGVLQLKQQFTDAGQR